MRLAILLRLLLVPCSVCLLLTLGTTSYAAVAPAYQWPPALSDVQNVNFAIFQASSQSAPAIVYDITQAPFNATCNGIADDAAAFDTFHSTANTFQSSHPGKLIELFIPSGKTCLFLTTVGSSQNWAQGLKKLVVSGYGATLSDGGTGTGFFTGAGSHAGISQVTPNAFALLNTVTAGSTCVTTITAGNASKWTAGDWALISGIDLQGGGFPPNFGFFEYVQIASSNAGTGQVCFQAALKYAYKSTWPSYTTGQTPYLGGPATLYAFDNQDWDIQVEYKGMTISQAGTTLGPGRDVTFTDVTAGNGALIPTQNASWKFINGSQAGLQIEIDKVIGTAIFQNTTVKTIDFQSASVQDFQLINSTVTNLNGNGIKTTISGSTIASFQVGAHSYGASGEVIASNSTLSAISSGGAGLASINLRGTWASGQLTVPHNFQVISAANNGSGLIRLLVDSTAGYSTGLVTDVVALSGSASCQNGPSAPWVLTVIDSTHFDLQGSTFVATCSGNGGSLPFNWAVPGANIHWQGRWIQGPGAQVTDITQDATNTYVQTSLAGGFPTMPLNAGSATVITHPAPKFTCTNCIGSADAVDLSNPGAAGLPLWSYSKRSLTASSCSPSGSLTGSIAGNVLTVTATSGGLSVGQIISGAGVASGTVINSFGTGTGGTGTYNVNNSQTISSEPMTYVAQVVPIYGILTSLNTIVSAAYLGASLNITINNPFIQDLTSTSTSTDWNPTVNAKIASGTPRVVTPTTTSGAQSGDSLVTPSPGANTWLVQDQISPECSANVSGSGDPVAATVEIITNQGVVYP